VTQPALVLVRRTAVTHWSSRRHDASASARTGKRRHQRAEVEVAAQVDPHDARQRLHGAQRRVEVLRGEARQHDGDRGFAPRRPRTRLVLGARRGLGTVG
jgi:hypothetical protein